MHLTYPLLTVLFGVSAVLGTSVALAKLPAWLCYVPLGLFALGAMCKSRVRRTGWCLPSYCTWMIAMVCAVPILFYGAACNSSAVPNVEPIRSMPSCIVRGWVSSFRPIGTMGRILVLNCESIVFPARKEFKKRLSIVCWNNTAVVNLADKQVLDISQLHEGAAVTVDLHAQPKEHRSDSSHSDSSYRDSITCKRIWVESRPVDAWRGMCVTASSLIESKASFLRLHLVGWHEQHIGENEGSLLASMVLGDKAVELDDGIVKMFRDVGLSHVLAASGFNLTVVIAMTYFVTRILGGHRSVSTLVCFLTMLVYVSLAGASASVTRAAIMCGIVLLLGASTRRADMLATLAVALIVTIACDANSLTDVGLQLSYIATVGLLIAAQPLSRILAGRDQGIRKWVGETVAVVLCSQSAVLPIQLISFWQVGLMFLPANLIVTPLLAPLTILGFASSSVQSISLLLPPLSGLTFHIAWFLDWLTLLPLKLILGSVRFLSSFDSAILRLGAPQWYCILFYCSAWMIAAFTLHLKRFRVFSFALLGLALSCLVWRPEPDKTTLALFHNGVLIADRNRAATYVEFAPDAKVAERGKPSKRIEKFAASRGWHLTVNAVPPCIIETKDACFNFGDSQILGPTSQSLQKLRQFVQTKPLVYVCMLGHKTRLPLPKERPLVPSFVLSVGTSNAIERLLLAQSIESCSSEINSSGSVSSGICSPETDSFDTHASETCDRFTSPQAETVRIQDWPNVSVQTDGVEAMMTAAGSR